MDSTLLKSRIDELLDRARRAEMAKMVERANEVLQGTITVMSAVYGPDSHQVKTLLEATEQTVKKAPHNHVAAQGMAVLTGALRNLKAEIDAGLMGSLQRRIAGDVLTDFIQLAKAALDEAGDQAKNVAAVLTAAAFEDTIRRMGSTFAGVIGKEDLSKVIDTLKTHGILMSPQLGIAQSYLNFRNHALHANWDKIDRAAVQSALGFVEQLLLKHFQ